MIAATSIGPGAANMVTAAGTAMANRLPVLLLAGWVFRDVRVDLPEFQPWIENLAADRRVRILSVRHSYV